MYQIYLSPVWDFCKPKNCETLQNFPDFFFLMKSSIYNIEPWKQFSYHRKKGNFFSKNLKFSVEEFTAIIKKLLITNFYSSHFLSFLVFICIGNGTQWIILFLKGIVWFLLVSFLSIKDFLFVSVTRNLNWFLGIIQSIYKLILLFSYLFLK